MTADDDEPEEADYRFDEGNALHGRMSRMSIGIPEGELGEIDEEERDESFIPQQSGARPSSPIAADKSKHTHYTL